MLLLRHARPKRWDRLLVSSLVLLACVAPVYVAGYHIGDHWRRSDYQERATLASANLPEGTVLYTRVGDSYFWNAPGIVAAHLPPEFPRDPKAPPAVLSAEALNRLVSSIEFSYASGRSTAVMGLNEVHAALLDLRLEEHGLSLKRSQNLEFTWVVDHESATAR